MIVNFCKTTKSSRFFVGVGNEHLKECEFVFLKAKLSKLLFEDKSSDDEIP